MNGSNVVTTVDCSMDGNIFDVTGDDDRHGHTRTVTVDETVFANNNNKRQRVSINMADLTGIAIISMITGLCNFKKKRKKMG